jgi:hypothetical protein
VPSEGTVQVNPADGTVLRTTLRIKDFTRGSAGYTGHAGTAHIEVSYARVPDIDMWLPDVMVESYEVPRGARRERTATEARYTNYRRFQTSGRIK